MAISRHPALQVNVLVQNDLDLEMSVPDVPPNTPVTGVNVGVNMNMNMPRIVVSREDGHEEKMEESEIERGDDGMVVVGISGATSSGKTTLAIILSEIFTTPTMPAPISLGALTSTPTPTTTPSRGNLLIHQDLFFYNKGAAETTTFTARSADAAFCRKTLEQGDEVGEYVLSRDGKGSWSVGGPDTDHVSAVNMWGLLKAVLYARGEGAVPDIKAAEEMGGSLEYGMPMNVRVTQEQIDEIKTEFAGIIATGKKEVAEWIRKRVIGNDRKGIVVLPRFLFVEGFLLYHKPDSPDSQHSHPTRIETPSKSTKDALQDKEDRIAYDLLHHLAKKLKRGKDCTNQELDYIQEHHYLALLRAFKQLTPVFDVKLFLPTTMEFAKQTRMKRLEYVDEPDGLRKPGEMWKTEGYFEDVAWRNHVLAHKWLLDWRGVPKGGGGVGKGGVDVRGEFDAGVEETVIWAVKTILERVGDMQRKISVVQRVG